jgi:hypothetical protein
MRAFYGYRMNLCKKFTMQQYRQKNQGTQDADIFENTVMRLVYYVLKWVNTNNALNEYDVTHNFIMDTKKRLRGASRCDFGLFSNKYIESCLPVLNMDHHSIVQGHLYEWALVLDLCLPGFREKVENLPCYLTPDEAARMFSANNNKRLYNAL